MSDVRGCLKPTCLGCLVLVGIVVLVAAVVAVVAWRNLDERRVQDREVAMPSVGTPREGLTGPGRLILELGQGEFRILPARPGEDLRVEAHYDAEVHELSDRFEARPDSGWVYEVRFRRTMPALQALFRALMGGGVESWVHVYIPPDLPIELELRAEEGGMEADLGGLWIRAADLRFSKGGCSLEIGEPLREPMRSLTIVGRMGGLAAEGLGNASPGVLIVDYRMGGADIDLGGAWSGDCDASLRLRMGGMSVELPDDVEVLGVPGADASLRRSESEVPLPVLRIESTQSMGEIEFR